jgi:hypothetical protein
LTAQVDALGSGVALEEPLDVGDVGAGLGEGRVGQAQAGGQAPMKLTPVSTPPRAPGSSSLEIVATATPPVGRGCPYRWWSFPSRLPGRGRREPATGSPEAVERSRRTPTNPHRGVAARGSMVASARRLPCQRLSHEPVDRLGPPGRPGHWLVLAVPARARYRPLAPGRRRTGSVRGSGRVGPRRGRTRTRPTQPGRVPRGGRGAGCGRAGAASRTAGKVIPCTIRSARNASNSATTSTTRSTTACAAPGAMGSCRRRSCWCSSGVLRAGSIVPETTLGGQRTGGCRSCSHRPTRTRTLRYLGGSQRTRS